MANENSENNEFMYDPEENLAIQYLLGVRDEAEKIDF